MSRIVYSPLLKIYVTGEIETYGDMIDGIIEFLYEDGRVITGSYGNGIIEIAK
jgi:hypothetical protein